MAADIPFVYVLDGAATNVVWAVFPIIDCGHYAIALEGPLYVGLVANTHGVGLYYEFHKFGVWHSELPAQTGSVGVDFVHSILSFCFVVLV